MRPMGYLGRICSRLLASDPLSPGGFRGHFFGMWGQMGVSPIGLLRSRRASWAYMITTAEHPSAILPKLVAQWLTGQA